MSAALLFGFFALALNANAEEIGEPASGASAQESDASAAEPTPDDTPSVVSVPDETEETDAEDMHDEEGADFDELDSSEEAGGATAAPTSDAEDAAEDPASDEGEDTAGEAGDEDAAASEEPSVVAPAPAVDVEEDSDEPAAEPEDVDEDSASEEAPAAETIQPDSEQIPSSASEEDSDADEITDVPAGVPDESDADELRLEAIRIGGRDASTGLRLRQPGASLRSDEIARRGASSYGELLDGEPGVAQREFGPATGRPIVRGFDGERVLILQDGERMGDLSATASDHGIPLDPLAAQRVDIIRGPMGLIYGSGAVGGVVRIDTDELPLDWEPYSEASVQLEGEAARPTGAVFLRGRAAGESGVGTVRISYRIRGDERTPDGPLDGTDLASIQAGAGGTVRVGQGTVGLALESSSMEYGLPEGDPDEDVRIRMQRSGVRARTFFPLGGFFSSLELRAAGWLYDHKEIEIEDGEEDIPLEFDVGSVSSTFLLSASEHGPLNDLVIGAASRFEDLRPGGEEALHPAAQTIEAALFSIAEFQLIEPLAFQIGARGEIVARDIRSSELFPDPPSVDPIPLFAASLGFVVDLRDDLEFTIQGSRGHRVPAVEELFADAPHLGVGRYEIGDPTLRSEIVHGVDAVLAWTHELVRAELAGFYSQISDYVILEPLGTIDEDSGLPIFEYRATDAAFVGGEASVALRLDNGFLARAGFDAVYSGREGLGGEALPFTVPLRVSGALGYDRGLFEFGLRLLGRGKAARTAPDEDTTAGSVVLGADAALRFMIPSFGFHRIGIRADNLLNTAWRDHLSRTDLRDKLQAGRDVRLLWRVEF